MPTIDISIRQEYISNHISGDVESNGVPLLDNQALNLDDTAKLTKNVTNLFDVSILTRIKDRDCLLISNWYIVGTNNYLASKGV